jgi:allantoate deiminase
MIINSARLKQHFEAMSLIGKIGETGTNRPTLSKTEKQAFELATTWMQEAGMKVHIDNFGNLIGRLEGTNPELPLLMLVLSKR